MDQHVANVATKAGLDPAAIIAIIDAIGTLVMKFMSGCQPPPTPKSVMGAADGALGTLVIHRALRQCGHHPLLPEGQRIVAALKDEAKAVDDATAAQLFALWQP